MGCSYMENLIIKGRIEALRNKMREQGIHWYLVPTADFHNSEYVNEYFKAREFLTGFTGSNGTLVLSEHVAGLWTDGRYFIQAEKELEGTEVTLYRMSEEGVLTITEFLQEHVQAGEKIGLDGRVIPAALGKQFAKIAGEKKAVLCYEEDIVDAIWTDRPPLPKNRVILLPDKISGETVRDKLKKVHSKMRELGADTFVLGKLDDIMWLFNLRGSDISCNPVALSYAIITLNASMLFVQDGVITKEQAESLGVPLQIKSYGDITQVIQTQMKGKRVLTDIRNINYTIFNKIEENNKVIEEKNPTDLLKAIKNPIEIQNIRETYLKDSVAVTKFIYWVKKIIRNKTITEVEAADYLDSLRRQIPGFLDLSFETISAYKENAAMMHYTATPANTKVLEPEGMLLVDSGAQYMGGTTDVTRTICLGAISSKAKMHFTYVCMGMLNLLNARFLYGCTGCNLDILARELLWSIDTDYKCGTGHGIGYILNVHEGPQSIRWHSAAQGDDTAFEAGMLVSNEPGVYIEDEYGIRIENIMLCQKGNKNKDGQFMYFEPLTFVPIDREAMDISLMTKKDMVRFNQYHKDVYEKISPFLDEKERIWLKEATQPF